MTVQGGVMYAIDDPGIGPRLAGVKIATPDELSHPARLALVRTKIEAAKALDEDSPKGKKNRALLELAVTEYSHLTDLEKQWLSEEERFRWLGEWDPDPNEPGDPFRELEEPQLITQFVIDEYRNELRRFRIAVIMQEKIAPVMRRGRLGTAAKLPGKQRFLSGRDAVITLGFNYWRKLTDRDRQRLIHHELEHLDVDDEGKLILVGHDFEDFASIVNLYGLRSESGGFSLDGDSARAIEARVGAQLELLDRNAA